MIALKASGYCACRSNWITTRRLKHRECNSPLKIIDLVAVRLPISSPCITSLANLFFAPRYGSLIIPLVANKSQFQTPRHLCPLTLVTSVSLSHQLNYALLRGLGAFWPAPALIVLLWCKMFCSLSLGKANQQHLRLGAPTHALEKFCIVRVREAT